MIYFITVPGLPYVKIGKADNIWQRISSLQVGCPLEYKLIARADGDLGDEGLIHEEIEDAHFRGEWYKLDHPKIQDLLKAISEGKKLTQWAAKSILQSRGLLKTDAKTGELRLAVRAQPQERPALINTRPEESTLRTCEQG